MKFECNLMLEFFGLSHNTGEAFEPPPHAWLAPFLTTKKWLYFRKKRNGPRPTSPSTSRSWRRPTASSSTWSRGSRSSRTNVVVVRLLKRRNIRLMSRSRLSPGPLMEPTSRQALKRAESRETSKAVPPAKLSQADQQLRRKLLRRNFAGRWLRPPSRVDVQRSGFRTASPTSRGTRRPPTTRRPLRDLKLWLALSQRHLPNRKLNPDLNVTLKERNLRVRVSKFTATTFWTNLLCSFQRLNSCWTFVTYLCYFNKRLLERLLILINWCECTNYLIISSYLCGWEVSLGLMMVPGKSGTQWKVVLIKVYQISCAPRFGLGLDLPRVSQPRDSYSNTKMFVYFIL